MNNFDKLKSAIAAAAEKYGIAEYEIYYSYGSSLSVSALRGEISNFSSDTSGEIGLRCLIDGKMGCAGTELLEESEMERLVIAASNNAKYIEKEDTVGFYAGAESYPGKREVEVSIPDAEKLKAATLEIHRATYAASDKVTDGTESGVQAFEVTRRLCNSHGLDLENSAGTAVAYASAIVKVGEESEDGFEMTRFDDGFDAVKLANKTAESALERVGADDNVPSGKYNVVIDARSMRSMLATFSSAFSARQAQLGMSPIGDKEGQRIASEIVTITDDPMREGNPMSTYFDAEGVPAYRKMVVEKGIFKTFLHNRTTAKKAGVETTGNASRGGASSPVSISPYSFCIEAGENTLDGLFEKARNGIYITEIKGLHAGANAVTGDFSLECAGFMIEGGKKSRPVKSFTMAGNFFAMLSDVTALTNEIDVGVPTGMTSFGSPSALITGMSVAGK